MEYRLLGETGLRVSAIGFGGMGIGGGLGSSIDDQKAIDVIKEALRQDITFFDTALAYGNGLSERLIGKATAGHKVVVATKVPRKNALALDNPHPNVKYEFPRKHILQSARKSYDNLDRTIDILQLHAWRDEWLDSDEWVAAMRELQEEGIIRFFGVSIEDHSPETAIRLVQSGLVHSVQLSYSIFDQSAEQELFKLCESQKIGIIARGPLDKGSLSGSFTCDTYFSDYRKYYFTPSRLQEVVRRVERLRWLEKKNRSMAQAAIQFSLASPLISTVIVGMRTADHVIENASAASGRISRQELERLKKHHWKRRYDLPWTMRKMFSVYASLRGHDLLR